MQPATGRTTGKKIPGRPTPGEWVGGRLQLPTYIIEPAPYRPDVVMWCEPATQVVLHSNVVEPNAPMSATVDGLLEAMKNPAPGAGPARRPKSIRVADPKLADLIRPAVGDGIDVRVAATPEIDFLVKNLSESFAEEVPEPSYLEGGKVQPETVAQFFKAAAALYRAAPWDLLHDCELLRLDVPELGVGNACISVIGAAGQSFGLIMFESIEGFDRFAALGERAARGDKPPSDIGVEVFSINFDQGSRLPKSLRREVGKYGWEVVSPEAYPLIQSLDSDLVVRPLTERDVVYATAISLALAEFMRGHREELQAGLDDPITETYPFEDLEGRPRVQITAPHPEAKEAWSDGDGGEPDFDAEIKAGREVVEAFLKDQKSKGRGRSWRDAAEFVCDDLYNFKVHYADGSADGWDAGHVEEYMLDYFPRKVSADDELIGRTPEVLESFFRWLGEAGRLTPKAAEAICKRVTSKTKKFRIHWPELPPTIRDLDNAIEQLTYIAKFINPLSIIKSKRSILTSLEKTL